MQDDATFPSHREDATNPNAWITWEHQTRNKSMAKLLGCRYIELTSRRGRFTRYAVLITQTVPILLSRQHTRIYVQNPSLVLATLAVLLSRLVRKQVFVDAHNSGINPLNGRSRVLNAVAEWVIKHAEVTIVSNARLASHVERLGGRSFVMPDPIPFPPPVKQREHRRFDAVFICSWANDEPFDEVIAAATELPHRTFAITGNYRKVISDDQRRRLPSNVFLTGFIPEDDYWNLISSCSVLLDLTTREDCLVCGAYEAASVGVPCVLSDTVVNRETFTKGFVFTPNSREGIARSVEQAIAQKANLCRKQEEFRISFNERSMAAAAELIQLTTN